MSSRDALIALALSPGSMELKRRFKERGISAEFIRVSYRRDTPQAAKLALAWLYWLTDGKPAGAELDPAPPKPNWLLKLKISDSSLEFLSNGREKAELRLAERPLALPEGDGGYYRRLEIEEMGESRMLPDRIIDECIDFADSLHEVFHENRPFLL